MTHFTVDAWAANLVDTGLVVRYYLDEAASGTSPTQVNDSSGNNYHLTEVNYGSGNMTWTELSGTRGLESTSVTGTQRARRTIDNTSDALRDAMNGVQKATIEVVVRGDAFTTNNSRIFGINGRAGESGEFILKARAIDEYFISWNEAEWYAGGSQIDPGTTQRMVLCVVVDTTRATQNERVQYSVNGGNLTNVYNEISQNDTLDLASSQDLIMFNRENSGSFDRSFDGAIFYAAMYAHAFSQADVDNNYAILSVDDDTAGVMTLEGTGLQLEGIGLQFEGG